MNHKKCSTPEETRELKASLWALAHFGTSVETVSILDDQGVIESMVRLGRTCPVLSVRHTIFHCLCLLCVTQPGAECLRKYDWYAMPRSHHEVFPLWALHNVGDRVTAAWLQQLDLDFPNEPDTFLGEHDKMSITSRTDSDSNMLLEEDEEMQFLMVEEGDQVDGAAPTVQSPSQFAREVAESTTSEATQKALDNIPNRKISYVHHRSQSDSQTLGISSVINKVTTSPPNSGRGNGSGTREQRSQVSSSTTAAEAVPIKQRTISGSSSGGAYGSFRGRVSSFFGGKSSSGVGSAPSSSGSFYPRSNSGSWKWRRSRSDSASESMTSGVSSADSGATIGHHGGRPIMASSYVEHIPTLSPIPSSASIATTILDQSQNDNLSPTSKGKGFNVFLSLLNLVFLKAVVTCWDFYNCA